MSKIVWDELDYAINDAPLDDEWTCLNPECQSRIEQTVDPDDEYCTWCYINMEDAGEITIIPVNTLTGILGNKARRQSGGA